MLPSTKEGKRRQFHANCRVFLTQERRQKARPQQKQLFQRAARGSYSSSRSTCGKVAGLRVVGARTYAQSYATAHNPLKRGEIPPGFAVGPLPLVAQRVTAFATNRRSASPLVKNIPGASCRAPIMFRS